MAGENDDPAPEARGFLDQLGEKVYDLKAKLREMSEEIALLDEIMEAEKKRTPDH